MKARGFSLIEIILGMALFAMVSTTGVSILYASLRSSRKAAAIASAKTEGAYALTAMETNIIWAKSIECTATSVTINKDDADETTYSWDGASRIKSGPTTYLTSTNVTISLPSDCPAVFSCSGKTVEICFAVDSAGGFDVTDKAGPGNGIRFQTWITSRNQYN